jgi:hypothetical protein
MKKMNLLNVPPKNKNFEFNMKRKRHSLPLLNWPGKRRGDGLKVREINHLIEPTTKDFQRKPKFNNPGNKPKMHINPLTLANLPSPLNPYYTKNNFYQNSQLGMFGMQSKNLSNTPVQRNLQGIQEPHFKKRMNFLKIPNQDSSSQSRNPFLQAEQKSSESHSRPYFPHLPPKNPQNINWYTRNLVKRSYEDLRDPLAAPTFQSRRFTVISKKQSPELQSIGQLAQQENSENDGILGSRNLEVAPGIDDVRRRQSSSEGVLPQNDVLPIIKSLEQNVFQEVNSEMNLMRKLLEELRSIRSLKISDFEFREKVNVFSVKWGKALREKQVALGYPSFELL